MAGRVTGVDTLARVPRRPADHRRPGGGRARRRGGGRRARPRTPRRRGRRPHPVAGAAGGLAASRAASCCGRHGPCSAPTCPPSSTSPWPWVSILPVPIDAARWARVRLDLRAGRAPRSACSASTRSRRGASSPPSCPRSTRSPSGQPPAPHSRSTGSRPARLRCSTSAPSTTPLRRCVSLPPDGRPLRIGIGGPVGSGKTALVAALCRALGDELQLAVVTNDIYTDEDAEFLKRAGVLDPKRITAVQTGCCPHTAIRDDISANLAAVEELEDRWRPARPGPGRERGRQPHRHVQLRPRRPPDLRGRRRRRRQGAPQGRPGGHQRRPARHQQDRPGAPGGRRPRR